MKPDKTIEDWIRIARMDWQRVRRSLQFNDITVAGFYLQQCLEKYLKAFLIQRGWQLKKIHELDALLDEVMKFLPELSSFKELCARVSPYYLADRYPPFGSLGVTAEDIEKDLEDANKLIKCLFPEEKLDA